MYRKLFPCRNTYKRWIYTHYTNTHKIYRHIHTVKTSEMIFTLIVCKLYVRFNVFYQTFSRVLFSKFLYSYFFASFELLFLWAVLISLLCWLFLNVWRNISMLIYSLWFSTHAYAHTMRKMSVCFSVKVGIPMCELSKQCCCWCFLLATSLIWTTCRKKTKLIRVSIFPVRFSQFILSNKWQASFF